MVLHVFYSFLCCFISHICASVFLRAGKPLFKSALWAAQLWPLKRLRMSTVIHAAFTADYPSLQNQQYPLIPVENTFILNGLISHIVN